eukprot:3933517-Rhodomonas_salina.2
MTRRRRGEEEEDAVVVEEAGEEGVEKKADMNPDLAVRKPQVLCLMFDVLACRCVRQIWLGEVAALRIERILRGSGGG